MSKENDINAKIAAASAERKKELYEICLEKAVFDKETLSKGADECAKAIYNIWSNDKAETRRIKDLVGIETSGKINGIVREIGKTSYRDQANANDIGGIKNNGTIYGAQTPVRKNTDEKPSPVGLRDAGKFMASQRKPAPSIFSSPKAAEKPAKNNDSSKIEEAQKESKQKITDLKSDVIFTTDNHDINIYNAAINAAENNMRKVDRIAENDQKKLKGKFSRENENMKAADRINKVTDQNSQKAVAAKDRNLQTKLKLQSHKEILSEFGATDKKTGINAAAVVFTSIKVKIKEIQAGVVEKKMALSTRLAHAKQLTNTQSVGRGAGRG